FRGLGYKQGWIACHSLSVPVIVVGNISVGGSGKTPFVIWLVELFSAHGYRPGIVSRGYGGEATYWPQQVRGDADPQAVGDEPIMLAQRCGCPIVVDPERARGAQALVETAGCDLIIADDGLQHYAMARDLEIGLIDGRRRFGNGWLLPAGPLREPVSRLDRCDFLVVKGRAVGREYPMKFNHYELVSVAGDPQVVEPEAFAGCEVHAVTAIGDPESFFSSLRRLGMEVIEHVYADHHRFTPDEICFDDELPVMMTEKDAVKCRELADENHWALRFSVEIGDKLDQKLINILEGRKIG
ncbi:MAG: tetraacyldisaccharide 4'-kinase, partial [Gammaproteobacteria bacterium]